MPDRRPGTNGSTTPRPERREVFAAARSRRAFSRRERELAQDRRLHLVEAEFMPDPWRYFTREP
jgi:hypothetical protein